MRDRFDLWTAGAAGGSAATAAAVVVLPWYRSGRVVRSGAALARVAHALGLVDTWPRRILRLSVALLPLLAAVVSVAALGGRRRLAGLVAMLTGAAALSCALLLYRIDGGRQIGPPATLVAAVVTSACGLVLAGRRGDRT